MSLLAGLKRSALIVGMLCAHGQAAAQLENITMGELALTPPYCMDVQAIPVTGWSKTSPSPRAAHWIALMGESFWAMHHMCWALIGLHRANLAGTSAHARTYLISNAVSDFGFVLKNSPEDFVLRPEVFYRRAKAEVLLGDYGAAIDDFSRSRKLKPDYWPSYVGEADVLIKAGQRREAQQLLREGLKLLPDEPNLVAALKRANGK